MTIQLNSRSEAESVPIDASVEKSGHLSARRSRAADCVPNRPGAEYYDTLLWRLLGRQEAAKSDSFLLGLTGSGQRVGVSTVAANLAIRAADHALGPVLLADFNFQRPAQHKLFAVEQSIGLAEVLSGQATVDECLMSTPVAGLQLLSVGKAGRTDRLRIDPQQIDALISQMREQFAMVICDLPAAGELGPVLLLAGSIDAALLVVQSSRIRRESAARAVQALADDGIHLLGAVVTGRPKEIPNWLESVI